MPAGKTVQNNDGGDAKTNIDNPSNPAHRTTFRPPWVKDGPKALPTPTAPWVGMNKRGSRDVNAGDDAPIGIQLRKTSLKSTPQAQENGTTTKENTFVRPQLRPVPQKEASKPPKENRVPINLKKIEDRPRESIAPVVTEPRRTSLTRMVSKDDPGEIDKAPPATRNAIVRQESMKKMGPPAPPMPPPAPALPKLIETKLSDEQHQKLEALRARPKTRPDWSTVLKNIENGQKLKHVETNDRSSPLLPVEKAKGQFLYESEKEKLNSAHNVLLKEIQSGIHLKRVKTNDRSKPMLEGLRKFRRQMTIEEQIQKSVSMASIPPEEIADEADEMDDIDKVRDDLQSTKQLLAFELRNKEAQMRENKKLQAKIQNLEAELEKEKISNKGKGEGGHSEADEKIINSLKSEAEQAKKISEELEKKYTTTAEELDKFKADFEEIKRQKQEAEKKLQESLLGKRHSLAGRQGSTVKSESEDENFSDISESEDDGEDTEEKRERRAQRELRLFRNKLRSFKNKEDNAKKERVALKDLMKKGQIAMKEEKKKYKQLQKEVDKISAMMKDSSEDEEEEEEEEEEEKEESETETESSESETETESDTDSESEKSLSESEDAPNDKKKENLTKRSQRHENILAALKKGNFMLKANVERLQDNLNKQKELTTVLQHDLDSVLAELG